MSDCRKAILHQKANGEFVERLIHDSKCLTDENNELWRTTGYRQKWNRESLRKYRGKGINRLDIFNYNAFAREVFEITFDLILDDVIKRNYQFAFPSINGGKLVASVSRTKINGRRPSRLVPPSISYHLYLIDFMKLAKRRNKVKVRFGSNKIRKEFRKLVKSGHTYPLLIQ